MKTKEEILEKIANKHSYDSWGDLMYDCHDVTQVEYTCEAMEEYASQSEGVCEWQCETYPNCLPYGVRSSDMKINEYKYCPFCGKPIKRKE